MKRHHVKTSIRKEQIAEAVLDILCSDGLSALTAERVAKTVGLVPSALYRHYSGKAAMLEAGLELLSERMLERLNSCMPVSHDRQGVLASLRCMLDVMFAMVREMQAVPRILFADETMRGSAENKAVVFRVQQRVLGVVRHCISIGQQQGAIRNDLSCDELAIAFMGMFVPVAVLYHASDGALHADAFIEANWRFFLSGIRPPKTEE